MEILQAYQTKNRCYKQGKKNKAVGILVHSTGAVNRNLSRYVDAPDQLGVNKYELRSDQTMEELLEDVLDQIWSGEYFQSRVKDVSVSAVKKSA